MGALQDKDLAVYRALRIFFNFRIPLSLQDRSQRSIQTLLQRATATIPELCRHCHLAPRALSVSWSLHFDYPAAGATPTTVLAAPALLSLFPSRCGSILSDPSPHPKALS